MKKILCVDVPEGNKLPAKLITVDAEGKITGSKIEVVELPTEEEIEAYALENVLDADSLEGFEDIRKWQNGAMHIISLLK